MRKVISHVAHLPVCLSAGLSGHKNTFETDYIYKNIPPFRSTIFLYSRQICKGRRNNGVWVVDTVPSLAKTGLRSDFFIELLPEL